jgi:endonuclease YncB( thermonuclease family)
MRRATGILCVSVLAFVAGAAAQDDKKPKDQPGVVRDRVKGSINHGKGKEEWGRIAGKVKVLDARTLEFADGTRLTLGRAAPDLDQQGMIDGKLYPAGKEAAEFLRNLIGDRTVVCILIDEQTVLSAYVGDTNIEHAMVINGWALAEHSLLHGAEIIARENKRGLWRGQFVKPDEWRAGKRLPGEK